MRPGPRRAPKIISYIVVIVFLMYVYYYVTRG